MRHIFSAGIIIYFLTACGNQQNPVADYMQSALGEPIEAVIPSHPVDSMNEISVQDNYFRTGDELTANILNIVNMFQFTELICCQEVMDDLAVDNYALLSDSLPQLFQVYQRNTSLQIPNFVTVDLIAQLSHVYESYLIQTIEKNHFSPMLAELCLAIYHASVDQFNKSDRTDVKNMAVYNAAFYAIPYTLLTGLPLKMPVSDYQTVVDQELAYIAQQELRRPALSERKTEFDYSVFKPYGHYTLTAEMRRYFRAWKWLQLAPYCCDNKTQRQQAILCALALQNLKTQTGDSAMDLYSRLTGAMEWFFGAPAYTTLHNLAILLKKERITTVAAALDAKFLTKVNAATIAFLPQADYRNENFLFQLENQGVSSCHKRLESLSVLQETYENSPFFAKKQAWNRKKTETSSALHAKMKHNMLLYGVVPDYSEPKAITAPADSLPLEPLRLGYVEPALSFWTKLREWVELTDKTLKNYLLTNDTVNAFSDRLHRYVGLMEDAAFRELDNERLSDEIYRFIEHIGDSIQQFTLTMIEPVVDRWEWVDGPDKSVDMNHIYVIVEIDGYLYLTKGSVFGKQECLMSP